jgi:hypothetical protein
MFFFKKTQKAFAYHSIEKRESFRYKPSKGQEKKKKYSLVHVPGLR